MATAEAAHPFGAGARDWSLSVSRWDESRALAEQECGFSAVAMRECKELLATAGAMDTDASETAYREAQQRCLEARPQIGSHTLANAGLIGD